MPCRFLQSQRNFASSSTDCIYFAPGHGNCLQAPCGGADGACALWGPWFPKNQKRNRKHPAGGRRDCELYCCIRGTTQQAAENSRIRVNQEENIHQGLKPDVFFCIYGTAKAVPFQSNPHLSSFSQPRKKQKCKINKTKSKCKVHANPP